MDTFQVIGILLVLIIVLKLGVAWYRESPWRKRINKTKMRGLLEKKEKINSELKSVKLHLINELNNLKDKGMIHKERYNGKWIK